jgi:phosphoglycerol transferase MdoB-like AlkP superfamily enzyme
MVSYLMVLPGVFLSFSFLFNQKIIGIVFRVYTLLLLPVITFLNLLDIGLYQHWGTRVGISAFDYIGDPKEMMANVTGWQIVMAILFFVTVLWLFTWVYKRFVSNSVQKAARQKWYFLPLMLLVSAALFLPIRGGLGSAPINLSTVSHSTKLYVNQASYNFLWYFFKTVERKNVLKNPCRYTEDEKAWAIFQETEKMRETPDSLFLQIDPNNTPNVLVIILESFSNKTIPTLGGTYAYCPNLDSICKKGIVFPSFYASGNRSDRGLSALLGSYPSLLTNSVINFPEKSDKLSMISEYFNRNGYNSSFYYGGDIDFYNLKSFVLQGGFTNITDGADFPVNLREMSNWGVPDGFLFDRVLNEFNDSKPFLKVVYTLSSHPPYDVPAAIVKGKTNEAMYLNSIAYTDSCLGSFIKSFRNTAYWHNTLVIITADHGALEPGPTEIIDPETYRIPLIFTGGVVKSPAVYNFVAGQTDLIPTLVKQFGWEPDSSLFGHDIFSNPQYAFYMSNSGWGYITPEGKYFYDQSASKIITFEGVENPKPGFDFAKAYLQVLHNDFLKK